MSEPANRPTIERLPPGQAAPMPQRLWWLLVLRGLAALGLGLVAILAPGISLAVLVTIFGAYALVDGAVTLLVALRRGAGDPLRPLLLLGGLLGLAAGLVCVLWPEGAAALLVYLIAAIVLLFGLIQIATSLRLRRQFGPEWPVSRGGIALIAIGILLAVFPGAVATAATWVIGLGALVLGLALLTFAWRQRQQDRMVL